LKREDWGGYVKVQQSSSNQLTLNSVLSKSKKPEPVGETVYYLFVRASSGSGSYSDSPIQQIIAKGDVDLVVGTGGGGGLPPIEVKIAPNPADNIITVDIVNNNKSSNSAEEYTLRFTADALNFKIYFYHTEKQTDTRGN